MCLCFSPSQLRGNHPCVLLAMHSRERMMTIYKPNIGKQAQMESLDNLQKKYRKVSLVTSREKFRGKKLLYKSG